MVVWLVAVLIPRVVLVPSLLASADNDDISPAVWENFDVVDGAVVIDPAARAVQI